MSKKSNEATLEFVSRILDGEDFLKVTNDVFDSYHIDAYILVDGVMLVYD